MSIAEQIAEICESYCADDSHGYSQVNRWGPDFDCSSLMYQCCYDAGLNLRAYEPPYRYTGQMLSDFTAIGFSATPHSGGCSSLQRGDILLNCAFHTVMYLGNGLVGGARISETGGTSGQSGDQTGKEICVHDYYDYPWDYVLRPPADTSDGQKLYEYIDEDGLWGEMTTRRLQTIFADMGKDVWPDGEVWHQWAENSKYFPACTSGWCYDYTLAGSPLITAMQIWLDAAGYDPGDWDGILGQASIRALEERFGFESDGVLEYPSPTVKALQRWCNDLL